ncbi:unnamed protein product [Rotaria sordida]|uniref:RING-type domain-containing protein n=1 Tax=Rotaria sordida TaxID=392033 RepID=A0A814C8X0_9BILA|nr:unnamed protein product [Rotaria sordida]CAF3865948.1 unnamed protein product [Rotaria sordida]
MLRWHKQKTSVNVVTKPSLLLSLLIRIHIQRIHDTQYKRLRNVKNIFSYLPICFLGLLLFQCHSRIYNAWIGPFPINLDQFATQFKTYTGLQYDTRHFLSRWFSFDREYFQIELGEDIIDQDMAKAFRIFHGHYPSEKLLYTFNHVRESTIDHYLHKLYVKLPSNEQSHIHRRLPYNFRMFHIRTLRYNLLLHTTIENKYYDRLFLIRDKYLVMLMIDFNEHKAEILRQFDKRSPFKIISIDSIQSVRYYHIVITDDFGSKYIYYPPISCLRNSNTSEWLHQRLIQINDQYRHCCEQAQFRQQQETLLAQQEEYRRHLEVFMEEEAEYQHCNYGYNFDRIWHRIASASPRFIAEFRLKDPQLVAIDQIHIECSLCYEEFRIGQHFTQWPCEARHTFHFDCMLNALRARNTCPICRHPVEAAYLPSREIILRIMATRTIPRFFN